MEATKRETEWTRLLDQALSEPGIISEAYSAFHGYSTGNRMLAWFQCKARGIQPGPIATFKRWTERGRMVRKGEKALTLVMPVTVKRTDRDKTTGEEKERTFTVFTERRNWFVLSQTSGEDYTAPTVPGWNRARCLDGLGISEVPFDMLDGNCQGFARDQAIAVSPVAAFPLKTFAHECAHVLLGHTSEGTLADSETTPRSIRETEAEAVAYLVCASLRLPGAAESRAYIQGWNAGQGISEKSAQKIFATADRILKAGQEGGEQ